MVQVLDAPAPAQSGAPAPLSHRAHHVFYSAEEPAGTLNVLLEGRVAVSHLTLDGRRLASEVLGPGDAFGDLSLTGSTVPSEEAQALTDCRVLELDSDAVRRLVESDPSWALRILGAASRRLQGATERIEEFAFFPAESRIASAVLKVASGADRTARLCHQDVADIAGTYRETATRILGEMQSRGIIRIGRCAIEVLDEDALRDIARAPRGLGSRDAGA